MKIITKSNRQLGHYYLAGEIIFREGDLADAMFVIQKGMVEINFRSWNGISTEPLVLENGQIFGEASLFSDEQTRCATARALSDSTIIKVDKKHFITRLHQDPSLAFNVLRNMAGKINQLGHSQVLAPSNTVTEIFPVIGSHIINTGLGWQPGLINGHGLNGSIKNSYDRR